jgi:hypothetical protein
MVVSKKQLSVDHLLIIRTMAKGQENYTKLGHNFYKDKFSVKGYRNTKKLTGKTDFIKLLKLELIKNIGGRLTLNQKQYDYETIKELQAIKLGGKAFKATVRTLKNSIIIVGSTGETVDVVWLDEFERRYVIIHN